MTLQLSSHCSLGLTEAGLVRVSFPFDAVTHAQLRKIRPKGIWRGVSKGWEFPFAAADQLQKQFGSRFLIDDDFSKWLGWFKYPLSPLPSHRELIQQADLETRLDDGRSPLPHQRVGVRWLLSRRGALLADEMGLGKTMTALLAARAMVRTAGVRVMVVAPVGLHAHWLREAAALDLQIDLQSWARLPKELPRAGTLLLVDEAHFAQSLYAKRTQSLLRLARHPRLRAIWLLTGTPMKNGRPSQLYPLLVAIDHPIARDQRSYEEYFCQGHWREAGRRRIWDSNGASNLTELRRLVRPLILNRNKEHLLGLPPKIREQHAITLSEREARGFDHRLSLVIDDYRERARHGLVQSEAESLAVLSALRQISAEFKLPAVSKLLVEFLNQGKAFVLFSSFVQPLKLLQQYVGGELLTGLQTPEERDIVVNNFQAGKTNLLLATYGAGSLGYTLHRASHVALLERPWTPGELNQAEDRCHRLGMNGQLTSHWFQLGFVDQLIDGLVASKAERIEVLFGNRSFALKRQSLTKMFNECLQKV